MVGRYRFRGFGADVWAPPDFSVPTSGTQAPLVLAPTEQSSTPTSTPASTAASTPGPWASGYVMPPSTSSSPPALTATVPTYISQASKTLGVPPAVLIAGGLLAVGGVALMFVGGGKKSRRRR